MADTPEEEWKKAQEGWTAAQRAAGAIPPLPQQNSTEGFAASDVAAFLRSVGLLRGRTPAPDATLLNTETVLNDPDLSRYGFRNPAPAPGEPGYGDDVRRDIASAVEQSERSSERATVSSTDITTSLRDDVVVGVIGGLIAVPLCDASWHAIVTEAEYTRGIVGLLVGLPLGIAGITFHWWKKKTEWLSWIASKSIYWLPVTIAMAFLYVAGPEIYRRAVANKPEPAAVWSKALAPNTAADGPISWQPQFQLMSVGTTTGVQIAGIYFQGISNILVQMKEASLISETTGHKEQLKANIQYKGEFPVDQVDIPTGASVDLILELKPPLSVGDFLDQWGKIRFTAIYNGITYEKLYDENYVRGLIQNTIPGAVGPRMTPRGTN